MKTVVFFSARDLSNVGGGERMLSFVANKLSHDYHIFVLTPYNSRCYYELNSDVELIALGLRYEKNSIKRKIQYFKLLHRLRGWIKSNTYDFFITSSSMAFIFTSLVKWRKDSRLFAWMHLSYFHPTISLLKWIEKRSYKKFNIISINSMDIEIYKKYTHSVFLIPNPKPFISKEKANLRTKRILSVGRLEKGKRFDLLIDICSNLFYKIPDWTLEIFGQDDGERLSLEKMIEERRMNNRIYIHDSTKDIKNEYLNSSIFATTTSIESFSLVLLEASECGLPCISFDVHSGPRDIIADNYSGYLIKEGEVAQYAEKLSTLMMSCDLRKTMGLNAVHKAAQYDETSIIQNWINILG